MRDFEFSDHLKNILNKLYKKDRVKYEAVMKKVEEIVNSPDLDHYKNLRYDIHWCIKWAYSINLNFDFYGRSLTLD